MTFRFDRAVAALRYDGLAQDLVRRLKFGRFPAAARALGARLADRVAQAGVVADVVLPVPLTWRRAIARGFNQSALIAAPVARAAGAPLARGVLRRAGGARPQARLDGSARRKLPAGTFCVRRAARVKGRRVLLVDDVMTTGATASRCAEALKSAGAASVTVAVAAR